MWTRRVLLATMVAAAAVSMTRLPASGNGEPGFAAHAMLVNAQR